MYRKKYAKFLLLQTFKIVSFLKSMKNKNSRKHSQKHSTIQDYLEYFEAAECRSALYGKIIKKYRRVRFLKKLKSNDIYHRSAMNITLSLFLDPYKYPLTLYTVRFFLRTAKKKLSSNFEKPRKKSLTISR